MPDEARLEKMLLEANNGDIGSLERLLLENADTLHRHIAPRVPPSVRSVVSVDDIMQETFSEAFRAIKSFQPRSGVSFLAWLKAIAENRLRDAVKRVNRKKRGGHFQRVPNSNADSCRMLALVELLSNRGATPSQIIAREEAIAALNVALGTLKEDYREAIRLRFIDGLGIEDVAKEMGRSTGAVRGLLDRAKRDLRASMGRSSLYLSKRD